MTWSRYPPGRRAGRALAAGALWAAMALACGTVMAQDAPPPLPEGFPVTIPFPEGFRPVMAQRQDPPAWPAVAFLVVGTAPGTVTELADFYRARLAKRGFEIVSEDAAPPSTIVLNFDAPGLDRGYVGLTSETGGGDGTAVTLALAYDPEEP